MKCILNYTDNLYLKAQSTLNSISKLRLSEANATNESL